MEDQIEKTGRRGEKINIGKYTLKIQLAHIRGRFLPSFIKGAEMYMYLYVTRKRRPVRMTGVLSHCGCS